MGRDISSNVPAVNIYPDRETFCGWKRGRRDNVEE
jgi:hypothetical protein